jgi:antitoxin FitA
MTQLILNDIDPTILEKLKARAANHQRSLEDELKAILQEAIEPDSIAKMNAFREQAAQMRQSLSKRVHTDSAKLVRDDRDR